MRTTEVLRGIIRTGNNSEEIIKYSTRAFLEKMNKINKVCREMKLILKGLI
jgi:hypothetical protein